jgi:hypothetical protein
VFKIDPLFVCYSETLARPPLSWALCIATLNRIDMLELCVACALD